MRGEFRSSVFFTVVEITSPHYKRMSRKTETTAPVGATKIRASVIGSKSGNAPAPTTKRRALTLLSSQSQTTAAN